MYYSDEIVEEVRLRNDIVDVISGYVKLQKKGASYFGLCPFHNEKSPSFSVSPGKQMYYCFGCGAGGNVYTFVMEYENFSFQEAIRFLAERAGIALPEQEYSKEARKQADLKASILEINKLAANYFYKQLKSKEGALALKYLEERQLSPATITHFGLGYAGKSGSQLYRYLCDKGYKDDILKETGLFTYDEKRGAYDKFWNRVMYPIMDVNNRVIAFGGRVMGDAKPKYLNSPETKAFDKSRNLYGLNFARTARKPYMILCEGYMDVIAMHQAGYTNAVASLGTAFTIGHATLLKRYVNEAILAYDSDEAGIRAIQRAVPILKEAGISAKVLHMEPYKDPDEFIKNLGKEEFDKRLAEAENAFFFELHVTEKKYDLHTPDGKTEFLKEAARKLTGFSEEIERNNYIEAVAREYYISYESLRRMVNQIGGAMELSGGMAGEGRPKKTRNQGIEEGKKEPQKLILTWLIEEQGLYNAIKQYITPEDFTVPLYQKAAKLLFAQLEAGESRPAEILDLFTEPEEQRELAALFHAALQNIDKKEDKQKALSETLVKIKSNRLTSLLEEADESDMAVLQKSLKMRQEIEDLKRLHISWE